MPSMKPTPTINVNGTKYAMADLSDAARVQVLNIQTVDREINRLKMQLAIAQTARLTYAAALNAALPAAEAEAKKA